MPHVAQKVQNDKVPALAAREVQGSGSRNPASQSQTPVKRKSQDLASPDDDKRSRRKRRKVNHACLYCQRSHMTCDQKRPCSRCIKRSISHLCHDEPREHQRKGNVKVEDDVSRRDNEHESQQPSASTGLTSPAGKPGLPDTTLDPTAAQSSQSVTNNVSHLVESEPLDPLNQPYYGYNDWANGAQDLFADMQGFHSNYMFNTSELSNEYNLLNDFLSNSILDDDAIYQGDSSQVPEPFQDASLSNTMGPLSTPNAAIATGNPSGSMSSQKRKAINGSSTPRPKNFPSEKAKETYFMTAADPAGTDTPEERMNKLLKAKYDAGMLKPFNYVNGYKRLMDWMESNVQPKSREAILQQFNKFRPKFRERAQELTDMELVLVEIWFERKLMEYDQVFASMAIPACCWRRTGEIFRGNREMCELIGGPLEQLRDGKLALHQILTEQSLVSYWAKFTAIAFEPSQKAVLTSCSLKTSRDSQYGGKDLRCCFSFTVTRDQHQVPALIVGNFLPVPADVAAQNQSQV